MLLSRISDCKLQMRTKSQTGLQCWEAEFLAHLVELKGHEHVAKAVTVGINITLAFVFVSRALAITIPIVGAACSLVVRTLSTLIR